MGELAADPELLREQYGDTERLRRRQEAHQLYSEQPGSLIEWVLERLQPDPGQLVLDAGCGNGVYHPGLARLGCRVMALDASQAMALAVLDQAARLNLGLHAIRGDVQWLPFPDASFERAMCNHVLFHVPDQRRALRELRRVLRRGGRVVLATNAGPRTDGIASRFSLDAHLALVREVFPGAESLRREDAFLFPSVAAALRYYETLARPPADLRERAESAIARDGVFRVEKPAGCFVATVL